MTENRPGCSTSWCVETHGTFLRFALLLFLNAALLAAPAKAEELYRLQPQTRLKIMVVEWVASLGEYREWTALNGEYVVSRSGTISVPLVGEIDASGLTATELASGIAKDLQKKTGLIEAPVTTVEVIRYPSIYVTGSVDRPGEFEYRPGLTALQALALAGGRARKTDASGGYSELEQIRYVGELGRINLELKQRLLRKARLEAELVDAETVDLSGVIDAGEIDAREAQFARDEQTIFKARKEAYQRQQQSLASLGELFREEIKILEEKMVAQDRQIKIADEELKNITALVKRGTVIKSRETGLERVLADLQSERLDLAIASMRAQQRLSETERDALSLEGQRKTEIGAALQEVNLAAEGLRLQHGITEKLLQASGASLSGRDSLLIERQPLLFTLIRGGSDGERVDADERSLLQPGDVLEVRFDLAAMMQASSAASTLVQENELISAH